MIQKKLFKKQRNNKCSLNRKKKNKINKNLIKFQMKTKNRLIKMKNIVNFHATILKISKQNIII